MEPAQTKLKKTAATKYITQLLESGHNKGLKDQMVKWVGDEQGKFDALFGFLFSGEYRLVQRAAWPISYIVAKHPELIQKHFNQVNLALNQPDLSDPAKRNLLRCLQHIKIPKKYGGKIANVCFNYINDPDEKPAIKAFSITVLENISKPFPPLRDELKLILENRFEYESAAFKSRARKILYPVRRGIDKV